MAQPRPVVRKTKKSSYKPLSQLNQDRLADLTRMGKPEYTTRVFYYNASSRARLHNRVNVWFRDHQHTLALLTREQRAVCRLMGRVQKDVHRVKRDEYKRRQEETRETVRRLRLMLLQRRVVQKFRSNAAAKMAARGEQSVCAAKLLGQRLFRGGVGVLPSISEDRSPSAADHVSDLEEGDEALCNPPSDPQGNGVQKEQHGTSSSDGHGKDTGNKSTTQRESDGHGKPKLFHSRIVDSKTEPQRRKSVRRFSEGDALRLGEDAGRLPALSMASKHKSASLRSSVASADGNLDIIREAASPAPVPDVLPEDGGTADEESASPTGRSVSLNSRVMEVRKKRPHSPTTHTRRATLGALPAPNQHVAKCRSSREGQGNQTPPTVSEDPGASGESGDAVASSNPVSSSLFGGDSKSGAGTRTASKEHEAQHAVASSATEDPNAKKPSDEGEVITDSDLTFTFSGVPTRDQALRDAGMFVTGGGRVGGGGETGRVKGGLAAKIRRQRQQEARRRAEILDSEPLVEYYRSSRGTLQPLTSQASRKTFPRPSGRPQYEQSKMLKEERDREVSRKLQVDQFFNELFAQRAGAAAAKAGPAEGTPSSQPAKAGHMAFLLNKMRRPSVLPASRKNSLEHLTSCQYLRVYNWDSKTRGDREREPVETSWARAESSLKAGFLALDLTKNG